MENENTDIQQTPEAQKTDNKDKPYKIRDEKKFVYLEKESLFGVPRGIINLEDKQAVKLQDIQKSIGVIQGVIKEFDRQTEQGKIEISDHTFSFSDVRHLRRKNKLDLTDLINQSALFSFWPTWDSPPDPQAEDTFSISSLRISYVRDPQGSPSPGYVEVVGKLTEIWEQGFLLSMWSPFTKRYFYIAFAGKYPNEKHLNNHLWITGKFDPLSQSLHLVESHLITFVPQDEISKIIANKRKRTKTTVQVDTIEDLWSELQKETKRTMINAKLKIVLKDAPKAIKDTGKIVCIPLENQPKPTPAFVELSNAPIELLVAKKMWSKAQNKVNALEQETKIPPVRVIEAIVGLKENKIVAVANSIQVMPGKPKKPEKSEQEK